MRVFLDGSVGNDPTGDEWVTLGAIAATDKAWLDFENKWHTMLRERYPIAPYVHMIELMDDEPPFDSVNGWTEERLTELITAGIARLSWMDKNESRMVVCSFNKSARKRIMAEGQNIRDPIVTCAMGVTQAIMLPYLVNSSRSGQTPERMYFFFDRNEAFIKILKKHWLSERTPPGKVKDMTNPWDEIVDIDERDLPNSYPLQAADMIAWAHTRMLPGHQPRRFSFLKEWLIKCVPSTRIEIGEEAMRKNLQMRA